MALPTSRCPKGGGETLLGQLADDADQGTILFPDAGVFCPKLFRLLEFFLHFRDFPLECSAFPFLSVTERVPIVLKACGITTTW